MGSWANGQSHFGTQFREPFPGRKSPKDWSDLRHFRVLNAIEVRRKWRRHGWVVHRVKLFPSRFSVSLLIFVKCFSWRGGEEVGSSRVLWPIWKSVRAHFPGFGRGNSQPRRPRSNWSEKPKSVNYFFMREPLSPPCLWSVTLFPESDWEPWLQIPNRFYAPRTFLPAPLEVAKWNLGALSQLSRRRFDHQVHVSPLRTFFLPRSIGDVALCALWHD